MQKDEFSLEQAKALVKLQQEFIKSYSENLDVKLEDWLEMKLSQSLPNHSKEQIQEYTNEIIVSIKNEEEQLDKLKKDVARGRNKEEWCAKELEKTVSFASTQDTMQYFSNLDQTLKSSNNSMINTITNLDGNINQNPSLDGFIAEQHHAQTFNINAEASGSKYRAETVDSTDKGSVDIVIKDDSGNIVKRYQSKYCKDAKSTEKAIVDGNYQDQEYVVPSDQTSDISIETSSTIEAPDGTKSEPLSKAEAKDIQEQSQETGDIIEYDYSNVTTKELVKSIAKSSARAGVLGACVGAGSYALHKSMNNEEIDHVELVTHALKTGADAGIKCASTGALKVAVEKGFIDIIPKGTPVATLATIAHVGIEGVKISSKVGSGELTASEGTEELAKVTIASTITLQCGKLGAKIGTALGPVGALVGGVVGSAVGSMAGSAVGKAIVSGVKAVASSISNSVKSTVSTVKSTVSNIGRAFSRIFA